MQASQTLPAQDILRIAHLPPAARCAITDRYNLTVQVVNDGADIPGSFWGDSEAGIIGRTVYVRADTPVHSFLHELSHIVCMTEKRRAGLDRDAGGDDAEECAVCYLQILLADEMPLVGSVRLMQDMDSWGYSFRLGSTAAWFSRDAADARNWLLSRQLITPGNQPSWQLRGSD